MKFNVTQQNLNEAVTKVSHIVNARNPLEILSTIHIKADKNTLVLQTNNLEVAMECTIPASVTESGSVCVPARLLMEVVNSITADKLEITTVENTVTITTKGYKSEISGLASTDFPAIPKLTTTQSFELPTEELKQVLPRVLMSVGIDDARPVLSGVYMAIEDNKITLAATDSYRLSEQILASSNKETIKVIIPAISLQEIIRLTTHNNTKSIQFNITESALVATINNTTLVVQLINGKYPDYTKIIPTSSNTVVQINREDLLKAVRATALFSREGSLGLSLKLTKTTLSLQAQTATIGSSQVEIPITNSTKESQIVLNAKYLLDALGSLDVEIVQLSINSELEPFVLQPSNTKDKFIHIIMPLRG